MKKSVVYGLVIGLLSVLVVMMTIVIVMISSREKQPAADKTVTAVENSRKTLNPASSYQDDRAESAQEETEQSDLVIFPDSSTVLLTDAQVQALSDDEIQYAIDEIYARHGFIFSRKSAYERLKNEPWYHPTEPDMQKVADSFNSVERKNVDLLATYRAQRRAQKENEA